jgi:hypothetical protein
MNGSGFGSKSLRQKSSKENNAIFRKPKCNVPSAEDWRLFLELGRPSWRHRNSWHFFHK